MSILCENSDRHATKTIIMILLYFLQKKIQAD